MVYITVYFSAFKYNTGIKCLAEWPPAPGVCRSPHIKSCTSSPPPPFRACFPVPPAVPLLLMMAMILLLLLLLPLTAGGYSWRLIARHYVSPAMVESMALAMIEIGSLVTEVRVGVLFIVPLPCFMEFQ